jgi:gliding motility-associated lipoprotein GldH
MLVVLLITTTACLKKDSFKFRETFDDGIWYRYKKLHFTLAVNKKDKEYDLELRLIYDSVFEAKKLNLNLVIETPDGEERSREYSIRVRDEDGHLKGVQSNGKYILEVSLNKELRFRKKGVCRIEIENLMPKIETQGIYEVGLLITSY